jgi:hypothetical protein
MEKIMKKILTGVIAMGAMAVPGAALAHGGPPVDVFTDTSQGSATVPFAGPCGGPGVVTVDFNDMFHVTAFADGHVNVATNQVGTFSFEPDDPNEASSTGRYRNGSHFTSTQNGAVNTTGFIGVGRDENGDKIKFHITSTFVVSNGEVRVDDFEVACG